MAQELTLVFRDYSDTDDEIVDYNKYDEVEEVENIPQENDTKDTNVIDGFSITIEELNDARKRSNANLPQTEQKPNPHEKKAIASYRDYINFEDFRPLIVIISLIFVTITRIVLKKMKVYGAKPPQSPKDIITRASYPNQLIEVVFSPDSTHPFNSIISSIQCSLDKKKLSIQEIEELCESITKQSSFLDIEKSQCDLSQYELAVQKIHELQIHLFSEPVHNASSPCLDFEIEGCGFRDRLLGCKRRVAAALVAVERTESHWNLLQEVERLRGDIARLQGDGDESSKVPIIKYMAFLEEADMTQSEGYRLAESKMQQLRAQEHASDRECASGVLTCSSMAKYQAAWSPARLLESEGSYSPARESGDALEEEEEEERAVRQDGVMVAVAGRDRDCTGERGAEVARLSPAHLPPAGAEVSEVLMSLVLISQQQQMLSEQQQRMDSRRQQEQLAKTEARRDWKDWKDTERDRRKTLNAREMGLQKDAKEEARALEDRLTALKKERSRRKAALLAADRWMLTLLLALAVALTAHWLQLLDLPARLDAQAFRELLRSALRLVSAALSSSPAPSATSSVQWCGNGTASALRYLLPPLSSLTPFLPSVGYATGWRTLSEYAAHAGAAAASYAVGGDAALWTEALQCLALVLKRSLPSILFKSACSRLGFSVLVADAASWPVLLLWNMDVFWGLLGSLRWVVALAFAHVAFAELLLLLDSGEDAPLQWKRPPLRAADLVLQDKQLVWSMGSAVDFRRPLVILSYSCLLATAVLISFLI